MDVFRSKQYGLTGKNVYWGGKYEQGCKQKTEDSCQHDIHISKPQGPGYNSNIEHLPNMLETLFLPSSQENQSV